jgi:hypothetical protein
MLLLSYENKINYSIAKIFNFLLITRTSEALDHKPTIVFLIFCQFRPSSLLALVWLLSFSLYLPFFLTQIPFSYSPTFFGHCATLYNFLPTPIIVAP